MDLAGFDGVFGKDRLAVATAFEIHCFAENAGESGEFCEHCGLIDFVGSASEMIDFLKSDQIGFGLADDGSDASQIEFSIGASAVVDIPAEDSDFLRW